MKHNVSWLLALVVGIAIGWAANGALTRTPPRLPPPSAQRPAQPPSRPTEDPRAVYRATVDDSPVKGPADALVTIVEVSDFECPFCKRAAPTLKQLETTYGGKVRFVFKQNPLPFHARAMPAAIATEEARAQGGDKKFWAMHDALFAAPSLDDAAILAAAKEAGLDAAKVKDAMASGKYKDRIERDQKLAQSLGATGTPSFFINGRKLVGAQPFPSFQAIVDEELKKAEDMVRGGTPASQVYSKIMEKASASVVMIPGSAAAADAPPPGAPAAPSPSPSPAAPPPGQMFSVKVRPDDPARGPEAAKLTVVLFSDFQCPFCARVEPSLAQLEKAFPGQVRIVWKHQPLPMHPQAMPAAIASEAARAQGKFWPFHDRVFENQRNLGAEDLAAAARAVGLDMSRYEKDVAARRGEARIQEDQRQGGEVGANGTPTMFFNCRQVVGALPFEQLKAIAEAELKKADQLLGAQRPDAQFYERICKANLAAAPAAPAPAAPAQVGSIEVRSDDPVRGNAKAPVTVVLFSDFQCPFCARVGPTLDEALRTYGDKLRVVWKHQPLGFHPNALPAATAAEAAREQGKFWQMHDRLFAAQRELSPDTYARIAKEIGLDMRKFKSSVDSGKAKQRIEQDQALAARIGAQATPTMFVNGEKVEGAVPFAQLKAVIDRKLGK